MTRLAHRVQSNNILSHILVVLAVFLFNAVIICMLYECVSATKQFILHTTIQGDFMIF